ncbi:MAG: HPr kinase/phosphorylase, partial [Myxococcales bacterium]|nr:HPr kinase/phosphorylase [Myxococcales bacterium]
MSREITVEVGQLFRACQETLELSLISDWGELDRKITRPRIQKAGLALSGFVKHVFPDRLQILGLTELDY